MRVTTQRTIGIVRTNTCGSSRSSLVWRYGTLSLHLCRRGHISTHPVKAGVLVDLAKGTETNRIWARASAALSVEGRESVELRRAILMVPGPFYPWGIVQLQGFTSTDFQVWWTFAHTRLSWLFRPRWNQQRNRQDQEGEAGLCPPVAPWKLLGASPHIRESFFLVCAL